MRSSLASLAIALLFAAASPADRATSAEALRIGGTGTATGMLRQVGAEFTALSGMTITVVPNLGSGGAIRALTDRRLDIAVSARPVLASESAAGLTQALVLRTAFVLATSQPKADSLKSASLPDIYKSTSAKWSDGTPIRIILRPRTETDNDLLGGMTAGMREALEATRGRPEVPMAATDQDNADMAERLAGSLTSTTATQLKTERLRLNALPLDGVAPTLANFESGAYRFGKKLYFIVRMGKEPDTEPFIAFLRSPAGVKALREAEVLPEGG